MERYITIKYQDQIRTIDFEEILAFMLQDGKLKIDLHHQTLIGKRPLKEIERILPRYFVRVNRSVIINIHFVTGIQIQQNTILMTNGRKFHLSRRQKAVVTQYYKGIKH